MGAMVRCAMLALLVVASACSAGAFNVDVGSCVRHRGPRAGSMFGFSVQEHVENGNKWVLVGAPEDEGTWRRPGVKRPGAVYRCDIQTEGACSEVVFDREENRIDSGVLQGISEEDINALIPNIGDRTRFKTNLYQWRAMIAAQDENINLETSSALSTRQTKNTEQFPEPALENYVLRELGNEINTSINVTHSPTTLLEDSSTNTRLISLLNGSNDGKSLLSQYETLGRLEGQARNRLCNIIIKSELEKDANVTIPGSHLLRWAHDIAEVFKTESPSTYYIPYISYGFGLRRLASGKLQDCYTNRKRDYRKSGLTHGSRRSSNSSTPPASPAVPEILASPSTSKESTGDNNDTYGRQIDEKSNQWFGATVTSTGKDGPIVACAPRYVSFVSHKLNQRDPVGTCFVAKNSFSEIEEYSPCRTSSHGYHRLGVCQAGFSAAVAKDGSRLFLGAPGSWYWQGQAYMIEEPLHHHNYVWPRFGPDGGQLYSQSTSSRPLVLTTSEGSPINDDSYLGYSVTVGAFDGQGAQGVAVGMPRGANLRGKVVLYTWKLENIKNVTGSQIGGYFGYSVASGDIDGDGFDDLVVGAPMYTVPNNVGDYEQGRVYVIYQGRSTSAFKLNDYRTGEVSKGRFGLSLTSLGDINLDSFSDFAVGAPYGGKHGRGVVYIYYGSAAGVREKYSQAITAEEVSPLMTTFGFSLSGGVDLDDNLYTDMVVGAYKSDMAVFFKSRPVVKVTASVVLDLGYLTEISLDDTKCKLRNGLEVACMDVKYCLQYDGINVDTSTKFELFLDLDSQQKKTRRLFFLKDETIHTFNQTILLYRQQHWCDSSKIYLAHDVRDKLTPLEVSMVYNLRSERDPRRRDHIPPVLDMTVGNVQSDAVNISKNCGPDKVCIPNLKMKVEPSVAKYLLGSEEKLGINVFVENSGEDAFEASYYLELPAGVHYVKAERLETGRADVAVHCATSARAGDTGNSTVRCDIGNPLPANRMVKFRVLLKPYSIDTDSQKYVFNMEVNTTNPEREASRIDNTYRLTVGVWVETNITLLGLSIPPDLHYNASQYKSDIHQVARDTEFGPHVVHAYSLKNNGPSFVQEAEIFLIWPYQTLAGEDLFYLLTKPETSGVITCEDTPYVNERSFKIEREHVRQLPQIIQGVDAYKLASNGSESFISEEERSRIEAERRKYSSSNQGTGGSQSTFEQRQNTYSSNSGRTQGGTWTQGGSFGAGETQYGSGSGQHGGGSTQVGSNSGQGGAVSTQYGSSSGQGAVSTQYGSSSGQGGAVSTQYGSSSEQGGAVSTQYGSSSGQGGAVSTQYGSSSGHQGAEYGGSGQGGGVHTQGNGREYTIYKERNSTVTIDEHGHVRKTETSTEYGDLGHEGQAGSSWSHRQGGYDRGSSSYGQGGEQQAGSVNRSSYVGYNSASGAGGLNLGWSTEESVNRDLFNAGTRTHVHGSQAGSAGEEMVGGEEESIGGFASVAGNPNNEFRTATLDVANDQSGRASSAGQSGTRYSEHSYESGAASGGAYSGGGASGGAYSGGVASGGAYSGRAASGGGYTGGARSGGVYGQGGSQSSYSASQSYGGGSQSGTSYHESRSQYAGGSEGSYSSESSGSFGKPAQYQQWSRRSRRQSDYLEYDKDLAAVLANCTNNFKCALMRCTTGPLQTNQEVWVALRGRINAIVLNEMSKEREVLLTTVAAARVSQLPQMGRPADAALSTFQAATHVTPQLEAPATGAVPLWVVVLAAVAGALLLLLLILLLYKCGFFKRNRPSDQAERQPLNRNGYGHGDERL